MKYIVNSIVAKISNICNLDCSYCYVYKRGDEHYNNIPDKLSYEHCEMLLYRIKEHCKRHKLKSFTIGFHGGEPTMLGIEYFKNFIQMENKIFKGTNIHLFHSLQTNGTLLNEKWAVFCQENNISLGFSLDGYDTIHDKNRIYKHNKLGSYSDVLKNIDLCKKYAPINVLSVIDSSSDVNKVYQNIKDLSIYTISFLFPDANYKNNDGVEPIKIAEWLIEIFDLWFNDKNKNNLTVFLPFSMLINLLLGFEKSGNDAYGTVSNTALLILTNGEIQVTGVEKESVNNDGYYVQKNSFDDVFEKEIFRNYYNLHKDSVLCEKCRNCLIKDICGGGRYQYRFSLTNGFDNPSFFCETMKLLIVHIQNTLIKYLPKKIIENTNIRQLNVNEL